MTPILNSSSDSLPRPLLQAFASPTSRKALGPGDLLVIEARAYHAAYARLESFYVKLRTERGCEMNLDLQRTAIATGTTALQLGNGIGNFDVAARVRWILEGRQARRIIVEAPEDLDVFRDGTKLHVCHLAELDNESVSA